MGEQNGIIVSKQALLCFMSGWNNPLPIGQSWQEQCGGLWWKASQVAQRS